MVNRLVESVYTSNLKQDFSTKHISYSTFSTYCKCPKLWKAMYVDKIVPYRTNIYFIFGTVIHESIQEWLRKHLRTNIPCGLDEIHLDFKNRFVIEYKKQSECTENITDKQTFLQFLQQGTDILTEIHKKSEEIFNKNTMLLGGIETLLYQELIYSKVRFKGLIDLVLFDKNTGNFNLVDIKTSTKGWDDKQKNDKHALKQLALYKVFFSKQFKIHPNNIDLTYIILNRTAKQDKIEVFRPQIDMNFLKHTYKLLKEFVVETVDDQGEFIQKERNCTCVLGWCMQCKDLKII